MKYKFFGEIDPTKGLVYSLLKNRGIDDPIHYLTTTEEDINDPLKLFNMRQGVEMLVTNMIVESKTLMVVDSDSDGFTSCALLLNYLHSMFPEFVKNIKLMFHTGKQHGLSEDINIPKDVKFIILPDSSTNDYIQHEELTDKGINILCIDHHPRTEELCASHLFCLINNKEDNYPNKDLSGGGLVYKFCEYIDKLMSGKGQIERFRDLAATACIGDMVDLTNYETKQIIKTGLNNINNPFLKGIVEKNSFMIKGDLTPTDVAFSIVPYLNAICRSGTQEEKELIFNAMLEYKCNDLIPSNKRGHKEGEMETILEQALRTCANVKNRQNREKEKLVSSIENKIKVEHIGEGEPFILVPLEETEGNMNLNGLIANELVAKFQKPVMLLTHKNGTYTGSARGVNGSDLEDFRTQCEDTGHADFATGEGVALNIFSVYQRGSSFMN